MSATAHSGVRHRCALLLSLSALLAGCAYDERLSLGRQQVAPAPPGLLDPAAGAAGAAVLPPAMPQAGAPAPGSAAPEPSLAPEPAAPPVSNHDAGTAPPAGSDASAGVPGCAPAFYTAELWCQVDPGTLPRADPRFTMPMSTVVSFAVEPTATPGWLAIRGGTLAFQFIGSEFLGRLEGGLDCATREFHAEIVDGSYASLHVSGPSPGLFQGELDGRLAPSSPALSGSWWHGPDPAPQGAPSCVGTWTARPRR